MPDDTAEACCASGICCDMVKQKAALAKYIRQNTSNINEAEAIQCAAAIMDGFDLVPKGLILPLIRYAQDHPYE